MNIPTDDSKGSEDVGNPSRRELTGLISVNIDRKYYQMLVQIQGVLIQRFPKGKWTVKSSLEKTIDMMDASMKAFMATQKIQDVEQ